jgi:hypothetical protein
LHYSGEHSPFGGCRHGCRLRGRATRAFTEGSIKRSDIKDSSYTYLNFSFLRLTDNANRKANHLHLTLKIFLGQLIRMDARRTEELGKKVNSPYRASSGMMCLHAALFCSAILLNLWALRGLGTCLSQPMANDGGDERVTFDNCQQPVSPVSVVSYP